MDQGTVARIEEWDARSFSGGYDGLHDLADADFSGAVTAAGAWLFMLNGRIVGVFDGGLPSFEGAEGRAYTAPDPSLPLLFAMQETGGETEGRYYTDDTPLAEVESTLSEGTFTGYVELSENVLSGDYYVVFYGGRSMSVAFVGRSERLLTGEDAFQQADGEVGIYEVNSVDLDVQDVPEPETPAGGAVGAAGPTTGDDASPPDEDEPTPPADTSDGGTAEAAEGPAGGTDAPSTDRPADGADSTPSGAAAGGSGPPEAGDDPPPRAAGEDDPPAGSTAGRTEPEDGPSEPETGGETGPGDGDPEPEPGGEPPGEPTPEDPSAGRGASGTERPRAGESGSGDEPPGRPDAGASGGDPAEGTDRVTGVGEGIETPGTDGSEAGAGSDEDPFSEEEAWRETRSIPALDPDEDENEDDGGVAETSAEAAGERAGTGADADGEPGTTTDTEGAPGTRTGPEGETGTRAADDGGPGTTTDAEEGTATAGTGDREPPSDDADGPTSSGSRVRELREALEEREARIEELQGRIEAVGEERDRLAAKRDDLKEERDRLAAERDNLEEELDRLQRRVEELEERLAEGGAVGGGEPGGLSPEEALASTDLFVRYGSKGKATLEEAHDGDASRDEVNANLRLENHTRFEAEDATVDGEPYAAFLESTLEFRFVEWLVEDLLYELQDAGATKGLRDLYDTLPALDRVAFGDTITAEDEGGEEYSRQFDVVCRDRMGQPLIVADLNDARDPATGEMMTDLVERSGDVAGAYETVAAAFLVTASFFEPDALETVADATGGGLLNRGSRRSYVKLSRKRGYHLCLVEARREAFHVAVPEL